MSFDEIVAKCQAARDGHFGALSTGEKLMAALVLDRPDWLQNAGFTIPQALHRIGPEWSALVPKVAIALGETEAMPLAEQLVFSLSTNRHDGVAAHGYTIAQALEIIGPNAAFEVLDMASRFPKEDGNL